MRELRFTKSCIIEKIIKIGFVGMGIILLMIGSKHYSGWGTGGTMGSVLFYETGEIISIDSKEYEMVVRLEEASGFYEDMIVVLDYRDVAWRKSVIQLNQKIVFGHFRDTPHQIYLIEKNE